MEAAVKPRLGRREGKALQTRHRVLDAADALFTGDGYASTTTTAIAEAADVAVQTLYAVFGTKRAILTQLLAVRIVEDDQAHTIRDREDWRSMEREKDPRRQVALMASIATRIGSRSAAILEVMAAAAGADPEIAAMYEQRRKARFKDQQRLASSLSRKGPLRPGLPETQAADIIWALVNARTYRELVGERQWTPDLYERWLADLLASALLGDGSPRDG